MSTAHHRRPPARTRRWFGWNRDVPTAAVELERDELRLLCLRRGATVTASGRATLPPGTVRGGRIRVADPVVDGLAALRRHLHLPDGCALVQLVQPRRTDVTGGEVIAGVDADEVAIRSRIASAAGFGDNRLEPVPSAIDEIITACRPPADPGNPTEPRYAEGAGWRLYRDGDHLEIEASDRFVDGVIVGPSPVERHALPWPAAVAVDRGVRVLDPWPLLLGAGLAAARRPARIDELPPDRPGGWTVERIDGLSPSGPAAGAGS
ncbi:MAG: hypothetical protein AAGA93_02740 [Actinomycetota bacterium]